MDVDSLVASEVGNQQMLKGFVRDRLYGSRGKGEGTRTEVQRYSWLRFDKFLTAGIFVERTHIIPRESLSVVTLLDDPVRGLNG